jgi:hypothetical protein
MRLDAVRKDPRFIALTARMGLQSTQHRTNVE